MRTLVILVSLLSLTGLVLLADGCVQVGGKEPLVTLNGGGSRPIPGNIPAGPAHDFCRQEMSTAMARINKLEGDLDECKRDRKNDKNKWEDEKKKLERERDQYKDRLKRYERD